MLNYFQDGVCSDTDGELLKDSLIPKVIIYFEPFTLLCDLGLGSSTTRYSAFLHHLQLASHDLAAIWQKKGKKAKYQIPNH